MKRRLTYANVTATAALFLALGGASYAVINIPRHSVGSAQLKNGSVGTQQLQDAAVSAAKLGVSAVTEPNIADGAVAASKLGNGSVGAAALKDVIVRTARGAIPINSSGARVEADCLNSERAIGGGGATDQADTTVVYSYPTNGALEAAQNGDTFSGWVVGWKAGAVAATATTYVLCLQP